MPSESLLFCCFCHLSVETCCIYSLIVSHYDDATVCGLVWTKNFVAYRCRTCGISPCMSLCSDCFHAGDHTGHDFNMFRSGAGGACDCGDSTVMKPIGYIRCLQYIRRLITLIDTFKHLIALCMSMAICDFAEWQTPLLTCHTLV